MSIWKKAILWTKIKDSLALSGILGPMGLEEFTTASANVRLIVALAALAGYLVGMWMEDKNKDGIVDIFQTEDNKDNGPSE